MCEVYDMPTNQYHFGFVMLFIYKAWKRRRVSVWDKEQTNVNKRVYLQ